MKEVELCSRGGSFQEEAMDALESLEPLELFEVLVILKVSHEKR